MCDMWWRWWMPCLLFGMDVVEMVDVMAAKDETDVVDLIAGVDVVGEMNVMDAAEVIDVVDAVGKMGVISEV